MLIGGVVTVNNNAEKAEKAEMVNRGFCSVPGNSWDRQGIPRNPLRKLRVPAAREGYL